MRLTSQTDIVIFPDEQSRCFDSESAATDLVNRVSTIEKIPHEVDNIADSIVFDQKLHDSLRGVLDWTEREGLSKKILTQPVVLPNFGFLVQKPKFDPFPIYGLIDRRIIISAGNLSQAQSDFVILEEEKRQFDKTETAYIEKISQVDITEKVEAIFRAVAEEALEGELEEEFAKSLSECIRQYEGNAINEIQHFILKEEIAPESAEATLRILGDIDHKPTYNYRRWLLEKALIDCSSPIVRDGANVGISYMDAPHAIPFLKKAILNEENPLLRKVMNKTLSQLEDTQRCL